MVEGYGYYGSGQQGDANGAIVHARIAMDDGNYQWVGELSPSDLDGKFESLTLARIQESHETRRSYARERMQAIDG